LPPVVGSAHRDAAMLAERLVPELVARGAQAVVLLGSRARGDATSASDLDLGVIGDGPDYRLDVRDGVLVAESWASESERRAAFARPGDVGSAVPGWREAVVLHDPLRAASRLKQEAEDWRWERCEDCDQWVAQQIVGYAEEVQKLTAALVGCHRLRAAVQRDILALRLAPILSVHHRMLYGSENVLWEKVGERMGLEWRRWQASAFSTSGESFEQSCAAAVHLFRLATTCVAPLLDERQAVVVQHSLAQAAGHDLLRE
jgi:predicted nucleotidyltransferase